MEVNMTETHPNVVITGASTGIGEACARNLAEKGYRVFAGVRKEADADRLSRDIDRKLIPLFLDVTEPEQIAQAAKTVGDRDLAGLVNNAGVAVGGPLEIVPIERLRMQLEINLIGQVAVTQAFLPHLRRAKGRVINIGSISGRIAMPGMGPYAISKFGLEAFSDSLRRELHPWGIHVSLVEPGAVATPIWKKAIDRVDWALENMPEEARRLYGNSVEAGRAAAVKMSEEAIPVEEVVKVVLHALTAPKPKTRYLVGKETKMAAFADWLLSDRAMDRIIRKIRER
jgi:NAD(P)-dependent dehydrogenase (short-subunit alcohol dehydrogenase family)